jgi:hypothetical protein
MPSWIRDQWEQIRGNFKYDLLKTIVVLGGSGLIAAASILLPRLFKNLDSQWATFGGLFLFSGILFVLGLWGVASSR